jgi:hypothetical protein
MMQTGKEERKKKKKKQVIDRWWEHHDQHGWKKWGWRDWSIEQEWRKSRGSPGELRSMGRSHDTTGLDRWKKKMHPQNSCIHKFSDEKF